MGEIVGVDGKRRIVIPRAIRERAGLSAGSKLAVEVGENRIVLKLTELSEEKPTATERGESEGRVLRDFLSSG